MFTLHHWNFLIKLLASLTEVHTLSKIIVKIETHNVPGRYSSPTELGSMYISTCRIHCVTPDPLCLDATRAILCLFTLRSDTIIELCHLLSIMWLCVWWMQFSINKGNAYCCFAGDFRMFVGEDKLKVKNIVRGSLTEFQNLYSSVLHEFVEILPGNLMIKVCW